MIHNKMSMAVKTAMGIAAVTGVMATGSVYAQDETLEEVVVTGSLIKDLMDLKVQAQL